MVRVWIQFGIKIIGNVLKNFRLNGWIINLYLKGRETIIRNVFVYDVLKKSGIDIGTSNGGGCFTDPHLPPTTKQWANNEVPGFIPVTDPQAGDIVIVRGDESGHMGIMLSKTFSIYAAGTEVKVTDFGSNPSHLRNSYEGNKGYIYMRYVGGNK